MKNRVVSFLIPVMALFFCQWPNRADFRFLNNRIDGEDFELHLRVQPGRGYVVEASDDLKTWKEFFTTVADADEFSVRDPQIQHWNARFFRAKEFTTPANDNFQNRTQISGRNVTVSGSNINATREPSEPDHAYFVTGHQSVWWTWTAPADGRLTLTTTGSLFDTLVAVYTGGALTNFVSVAKSRYDAKQLTFPVTQNTAYQIAVDGIGDSYGLIQLTLALSDAASAVSPNSAAGAHILLNESSDPNVPLRLLRVSNDGQAWSELYNGETNAISSGAVVSFSHSAATAVLQLTAQIGDEQHAFDYLFRFETASSGTYVYDIDGSPGGAGTFTDFRDTRLGLAPPDFFRRLMTTTREKTSTGPAGQTHFFTFTLENQFADSDDLENASGKYSYEPSGSTAVLRLKYSYPFVFQNESFEIHLNFTTTTEGTYHGTYLKNDGTVVEIDGGFLLEYDT